MESRLGVCEICTKAEAKYTCPGCEVYTCSVPCVKEHKIKYGCNGVRDKTAYVPVVNESTLRSDYGFLEEVATAVDGSQRLYSNFGYKKENLSGQMRHLRAASHDRFMRLWFMPSQFSKRKLNRSYYNFRKRNIEWTLQVVLHTADNTVQKVYEHEVSEKNPLQDCIKKILDRDETTMAEPLSDCVILLQAEYIKCAEKRYFLMDREKSLQENLKYHTLVEFPSIHVVPAARAHTFKTVTLEEAKEEIRTRIELERTEQKQKIEEMSVDCEEDESGISEPAPEVEDEPGRKKARLEIPEYKEICKIDSGSDEDATIEGNFFNLE